MTLQVINNGSRANDETAETLFSAFEKVKSNFSELYGIYGSEVEAFTFTTKQNDLALAAGTRILRWNGTGTTGITGIAAPSTARVVTIVNASTDYLLWLENENTASVAANRLMLPGAFPAFLMPGDTITLFYDLTTARWRVLEWPTRGRSMGLTECEDFIATAGAVFNTYTISGTVSYQYTAAANSPGLAGVSTSTASSCRPTIGGLSSLKVGTNAWLLVSRVKSTTALPDGTETYTGVVGFSTLTADNHVNAICWELRWNGSAAEWAQSCIAGSTPTRSVTGSPSPVNGSFVWLAVYVNAAGTRADFLYSTDGISFTLAGSASSGLPTSAATLAPIAVSAIKSAGTTARVMNVDIAGFRCGASAARAAT